MTDNILMKGNLNNNMAKAPEQKGWFLGSFIKKDRPFHTDDFEVKWDAEPKGWVKEGLRDDRSKTLVILITGIFRIRFKNDNEEYILSKQGDYLLYRTSPHINEALDDLVTVSIRWPSKIKKVTK